MSGTLERAANMLCLQACIECVDSSGDLLAISTAHELYLYRVAIRYIQDDGVPDIEYHQVAVWNLTSALLRISIDPFSSDTGAIRVASVSAHGRLRIYSYTRDTFTNASYLLNPDQKIEDNFMTRHAALCWCPHVPDTLASSARHPAFMLKTSEHLADTFLTEVTIWDLSNTKSPAHHTLHCPHPVKHLQFNSHLPNQLAITDFQGHIRLVNWKTPKVPTLCHTLINPEFQTIVPSDPGSQAKINTASCWHDMDPTKFLHILRNVCLEWQFAMEEARTGPDAIETSLPTVSLANDLSRSWRSVISYSTSWAITTDHSIHIVNIDDMHDTQDVALPYGFRPITALCLSVRSEQTFFNLLMVVSSRKVALVLSQAEHLKSKASMILQEASLRSETSDVDMASNHDSVFN